MHEEPRPSGARARFSGMRALQHAIDDCADTGVSLAAVFVEAEARPAGAWAPTNGNGDAPLPRVAAPLSRRVRDSDVITLLGDEAVLCTLRGLPAAAAYRRFGRIGDRLGAGPIRVGIVEREAGEGASQLADRARAASRGQGSTAGMRLVLELPADLPAAGRARSALGMFERELDPRVLDTLRLVLTELVSNAVRHGAAGPESTVHVDVRLSPDAVHGTIADDGAGFVPKPRAQARRRGGGLGLMIVDNVSRRWGVSDGGRRVWFELLRDEAVEAGDPAPSARER
jgi:anti-sigma regulatory factor (Ser/Thr protein kinase)